MASATSFYRGDTIFFDGVCKDNLGNPITPSSATLYLSYRGTCGNPKKATVTMTINASAVSASWDSSPAAPCLLSWTIKAVGVNNVVADGSVSLVANDSNPRT